MWLANQTRPDIANAVRAVARKRTHQGRHTARLQLVVSLSSGFYDEYLILGECRISHDFGSEVRCCYCLRMIFEEEV